MYNTCKSEADFVNLQVPEFVPSVYQYTEQFGLSFTYDGPKIWNGLPDGFHSATSLFASREVEMSYLCKRLPNLDHTFLSDGYFITVISAYV